MKTLRSFVAIVSGLAVALSPGLAHATAPAACTESYDQAQVLRKQGKLLAAREQLRVCAQSSCPALFVSDCTQWLDQVESSMPSVVLVGTDESGTDLMDVTVSIDGAPVQPAPGQAIEVDPGAHRFVFGRGGSPSVETVVLVAVGEKNKRVAVTLRTVTVPGETAKPTRSPAATVGLAVAGAGIVGLALGAIFGAETIAQQHDADCPGNVCRPGSNPSALRDAQSDGNLSTGFFIAGGVLAAAGATTWWLAPRSAVRVSVLAAPMGLAHAGGALLVGEW